MKYYVKVGEREREIVIDGDSLTIDGETVRVRLEDVPGAPVQLVRLGDEVQRILTQRGASRGEYVISVGGHRLNVEALDERARAIRELARSRSRASGPAHLVAPMPGLVVRVNVSQGDRVRAGQGLVVMEAMKMENELRAGTAGVVSRVLVAPGSAVEKGAILLEVGVADG
jgi:biotin carboxyl carrier protein